MCGSIPNPMGFIFSHSIYGMKEWSPDLKKLKFSGSYGLSLQLRLFWLGAYVDIHNNSDDIKKSFDAYMKKIKLMDEMATEAYQHLVSGNGPLVVREFLNDAEVNDGFGATLFIHVDPDLETNHCIFEVSSCYKKYRYGTSPRYMREYLKNFLSFMYDVKDDLAIIKERIDLCCPEKKEDGK